jgi:hypothetical protein
MMMAHDSTPGPADLDPQTVEAVRAALVDYVAGSDIGDRLRIALHAMAADARAKAVFPEKLLVLLKEMWYSLPGVQHVREQTDQLRLLQRVVTLCIKEYYAD